MTHENPPPSHDEGPAADGLSGLPRYTDLTTTQAMRSLRECNRPFADISTADDMLLELHEALVNDTDGQKLLFTHAHTLNAFYHRLMARAVDSQYLDGRPALNVNDRMADLALQAQKQCLQTLTALATLRLLEKNTVQKEGGKE